MGRLIHPRVLLGALCALAGCIADDDVASTDDALSHPGHWAIPSESAAVGDAQYVLYTGAGPWNDGMDCAGGLSSGAGIVRAYLLAHFPQIDRIGGYNCRRNTGSTANMSIHAVGRALDIMLPTSGGSADNDLGDPIGAWLIENAETIGIQYIIWDEWTWMAARTPGAKGKLYTGPNPHHDHLHVELSAAAGARTTDWFSSLVDAPTVEACVALGPSGGVIDDVDPCFVASGPAAYWRTEAGVGNGGSLRWTNAWMSAAPSNWARWNVALVEAGEYEVEVYLTAPWAVYGATRYGVRHAGAEDVVFVDQAAETADEASAWVSLGVLPFAAGDDQWVSVYDDVAATVPADQHVVVDAVRLRRVGVEPPDDGPIDEPEPMTPGEPDPDADPGEAMPPPEASGRGGRCSASHGARTSGASLISLGVALAVVLRRRAGARVV